MISAAEPRRGVGEPFHLLIDLPADGVVAIQDVGSAGAGRTERCRGQQWITGVIRLDFPRFAVADLGVATGVASKTYGPQMEKEPVVADPVRPRQHVPDGQPGGRGIEPSADMYVSLA